MENKRIVVLGLVLFSLLTHSLLAQTYGNEWIDFNQSYYKFKVAEKGVYRITRSELAGAGFPVSVVDPRRIQLYHLGTEMAITISGQADGTFNSNDYIEFYAVGTDGTTDTPLYIESAAQPHTLYNIFSDSAAYFLTYKLNLETGRRIDDFFENNTDGLDPETHFGEAIVEIFTDNYYEGESYGSGEEVLHGYYDFHEGWTGSFASRGQSIENTITGIDHPATDQDPPALEVLLAGGNNNQHDVDILVGPNSSSTRLLTSASFFDDDTYLVSETLQWSDISEDGELYIRALVNGVNGAADRAAISYIRLNYNSLFDLNGATTQTLELSTNPGNKSYLEIDNAPDSPTLYDVTDFYEPISIGYNEGSQLSTIVDNTSTSRTLFLQSGLRFIENLEAVEMQSVDPEDYNYLLITHEDLRGNTSDGSSDQIAAYQDYRASSDGGGHSVITTHIDQIFDQYNYGLPSPMAIRRYCQYMYDNGSPEFLFIIGKSSNVQARYYRQDPENTSVRHFVPAYGYPGADVPFTAGFDGGTGYETIATGRINADSPDDIQAYLNKVIEEESTPFNSLRQKNLVHLSGGNSENELLVFRNYINGFAETADEGYLGGESAQISKNNNSAVELINISDEVNEGVMMVTFFGHSTGSVTDLEIGLVSDPTFGYSNKGKYPIFMVNGCQAGDFFSENESFGVDWILTPNLGALGFMAHSHVAFATNLRRFTDIYYELAFDDLEFIAKSVGEIKAETAKQYVETYGTSDSNIAQVQLVNLQGDPAVKVFGADKPDFSIDEDLTSFNSFNGEAILATTDSFYVEINIKNFGIGSDDQLAVEVVRTLPSGSSITYGPTLYDPVFREDTIQITLPNDLSNVGGTNSFRITLDPLEAIDEMDENNNSINLELFISSGSTLNILPAPYAIVNDENVDFYFQSGNILTESRNYDFQLDTVSTFNSSFFTSQTVSANVVGHISYDLTSTASIADGKVFYWRTRFTDPESDESDEWEVSSFTLDRSKNEGWSQQRASQLSEMGSEGINIDVTSGLWEFVTTELELDVTNFGSANTNFDYLDTQVFLDGQDYFNTSSGQPNEDCRTNSINFLAFERQSTVPFRPLSFTVADELNSLVCGRLPQYILNYTDVTISENGPSEYIDALSSGDKVLIFSLGTVSYSSWPTSLLDDLESLGINRTLLEGLNDDEPIIFLGAKDAAASSATVVRALTSPANEAQLTLDEDVIGNFDSGSVTTDQIGPAMSWGNLQVEIDDSSNPSDDFRTLSIIGIDTNGNESVVYSDSDATEIDLSAAGINLDADTYPYIRLQYDLADEVQFTPSQLNNWEVAFETAPEGVLLKKDQSDLGEINELQEGESFTSNFTFWNISDKDFTDSLDVAYDLFNTESGDKNSFAEKFAPLAAGDSVQLSLELNTLSLSNVHDLILSVNEEGQTEMRTTNNNARLVDYIQVNNDETNPVVEVTFDGAIIIDGDIVSPNPLINISVSDENPYILKEDTLGMNFFLKPPCDGCDFERVSFTNPQVVWTAATDETPFEIEYAPQELPDGIYTLQVVAVDGSGNESGIEPYEINFEVINESTITNFFPYPNPFSTSVRFVFTLTGTVIPEDIKIQIMTISGRVVKEIFMDELGPIRIGNNQTEYAWDGRDNYGDQLANGVYLYKVMIKNPGENFERRETAGDRGFKRGFGKMYLLR